MSKEQWIWLCVGFAGQALFTSRFLIQWIVSEKKRQSVIPVAFWYLSLAGGSLLLAYAISRSDPVIILGQALGVVVYLRNLALIHRTDRQPVASTATDDGASTDNENIKPFPASESSRAGATRKVA